MNYLKICNYCRVEFQTENHSVKSCSDECRRKFRIDYKKKLDIKKSIERKCKFCNEVYFRKNERNGFCTRSCASKFYIQNGTYDNWRLRKNEKSGTIAQCLECQKDFYYTEKRRKNAKFCSTKCKTSNSKGKITKNNPFIINKEKTKAWRQKARKTMLKKYGVSNAWMLAKHHNLSKPQKEILDYLNKSYDKYTIFSDFGIEKSRRKYKVDFLIKEINLIIEFNGTYWHCDPRFYQKDYYNKKKKLKAEQIWCYDNERKTFLEELGYKVIVVWEHDYKTSCEQTLNIIRECIDGEKKN